MLTRSKVAIFLAMILVASTVAVPAHATFPGRNGLIAFTAGTDAGSQLFTVRPDGTELRQITHLDGDAVNVDWAPDGRRIVFAIGREDSARIATPTGRHPGSECCHSLRASSTISRRSPDGRTIYFERYTVATNHTAIWSMASDGNHQRRILGPFPNGVVTDPNVSPDGKTLNFQGFGRFGDGLAARSRAGTRPVHGRCRWSSHQAGSSIYGR